MTTPRSPAAFLQAITSFHAHWSLPWKEGFLLGSKSSSTPSAFAKAGSKKAAPLSSPFKSKRTRWPSLSFRAFTSSAFCRGLPASSIRHLYLYLCTAGFLKCPSLASKPQTRTYAEKLYQPLAALKVKCIALLVLVTFSAVLEIIVVNHEVPL
jgi:hypothetical protein